MEESPYVRRVEEAADAIRRDLLEGPGGVPRLGLVLGSGLGDFADDLDDPTVLPYPAIPGFPEPTVEGHAGRLVCGTVDGARVACLQGRIHHYEGLPMGEVVFAVRAIGRAGVAGLLLTNAAGGIDPGIEPGDLVLVRDHLNMMGANPLRGTEALAFGPRFPDMTEAYDPEIRRIVENAASACEVGLHEGVYAAMAGPAYETPAEIRMLASLGADTVGMSTVPEVLAARQMGMRVAALSLVTNLAAGIGGEPLDHAEVIETAGRVHDDVRAVLERAVPSIDRVLAT